MTNREKIEAAKEKFGALLEEQLARVERMKTRQTLLIIQNLISSSPSVIIVTTS